MENGQSRGGRFENVSKTFPKIGILKDNNGEWGCEGEEIIRISCRGHC